MIILGSGRLRSLSPGGPTYLIWEFLALLLSRGARGGKGDPSTPNTVLSFNPYELRFVPPEAERSTPMLFQHVLTTSNCFSLIGHHMS